MRPITLCGAILGAAITGAFAFRTSTASVEAALTALELSNVAVTQGSGDGLEEFSFTMFVRWTGAEPRVPMLDAACIEDPGFLGQSGSRTTECCDRVGAHRGRRALSHGRHAHQVLVAGRRE